MIVHGLCVWVCHRRDRIFLFCFLYSSGRQSLPVPNPSAHLRWPKILFIQQFVGQHLNKHRQGLGFGAGGRSCEQSTPDSKRVNDGDRKKGSERNFHKLTAILFYSSLLSSSSCDIFDVFTHDLCICSICLALSLHHYVVEIRPHQHIATHERHIYNRYYYSDSLLLYYYISFSRFLRYFFLLHRRSFRFRLLSYFHNFIS